MPERRARPIFICEIEEFGGAERALLALCHSLAQHNLPHYLLTYEDRCNIAGYAANPLEVVQLRPGSGVRNKVRALREHFAGGEVDAPKPLFSGYQPALHGTLAGLRGFHDLMHDTPALFGDRDRRGMKGRARIAVANRIIGLGLRSGGVTMVTSEYLRRECRQDFGVQAEIVRMGGLNRQEAEGRKEGPTEGRLNMLSVSRIEANKRIDWMLRALARLEREAVPPLRKPLSLVADWRLDLAGKGSRIAELSGLAEGLGIGERVRFHGFVSDEQMETLYKGADLFLMPAMQGYGIPAVEALSRRIPVLLHRESGVSDLLLDTPWASVLEGGEGGMAPVLAKAIHGVLGGVHRMAEVPELPTEEGWARRVVELCGWLPGEGTPPPR